MKNAITWVKAAKDYHDKTPELLVPFCTGLINQLAIDPDVPVGGIPAPLTVPIYTGMVSGLNTDIVARQNTRSITLTSDELSKSGTLLHNVGHGNGHEHIFRILRTAADSAAVEAPSEGQGSLHHWRWSTDQLNWTQVKSTYKSIVTISNLPQDVRVYFQYDISPAVGRGIYPAVSANADDFHWSSSISEIIPASTSTGN